MMKNTPFSTRNMISRKLSHSSNVSEGNVMVGGKPVCDDNWGMEEVNKLDTQTRKNFKETRRQQCVQSLKTKTKT